MNSGQLSDLELMSTFREYKGADKEKAKEVFFILYSKYHDVLFKLCTNVCGNGPEADMVYERTWERVYKYPTFGQNGVKYKFSTWLSRVARNVWYDIRQKIILGTDMPPEESCLQITSEEEESFQPPSIDEKLIRRALAELSDRDRDILLTYLDNDVGDGKNLPEPVIKELTTKYGILSSTLRQIKKRSIAKVKFYIEKYR